MFVNGIGRGAQRIIDAMVRWLAYGHINPNILTVIGLSLNVGCGVLFGMGRFFSAGIALGSVIFQSLPLLARTIFEPSAFAIVTWPMLEIGRSTSLGSR